MFILELTLRSWTYSETNKSRTVQKEDICVAIQRTDIFDFLVDLLTNSQMQSDDFADLQTNSQMSTL